MKKHTYKQLSLVLCFLMVFSAFAPIFGATLTSDYESHWAKEVIQSAITSGTVNGYPDGSFKPDNAITRAEFFTLVNNSFQFTKMVEVTYTDVAADAWYAPVIAKAKAAGYISGYPDGGIHPDSNITRQEAAVVMSQLKSLTAASSTLTFTDASAVADWSKQAVLAAFDAKIMTGYPDGSFQPGAQIKRAEALVAVKNCYNYHGAGTATVYDKPGSYGSPTETTTLEGNVIIKAPGVTLQNAIVKGDLTIAKEVGEGDVTLKGVTVKGSIYVKGGGVNSIYFVNVTTGKVYVLKDDGPVRIVASGTTAIEQLMAGSDVKLEEVDMTGAGFEGITVEKNAAGGIDITLVGVKCDTIDIKAEGVTLAMDKTSTVAKLTADAKATITGAGVVTEAVINASGVTFETEPAKTTVAEGVTAPVVIPPKGGGGGGGGGSGSGSGVNSDQAAPTGLVGVEPGSSIYPSGKITGTTTAMEYKHSEAVDYTRAIGTEITDLSPGTYHVRYAAKTGFNAGAVATVVVPVYVAPPQPQPAPAGLQGWAPSSPETADGRITGTSNEMEYKLTTASAYVVVTSGIEINGLSSGNYQVRYAAKDGYSAGEPTAIEVPAYAFPQNQTAPTGLIGVAPTTTASNNGRILNTSLTMEWQVTTGSTWTSASQTEISGLSPGTYRVRYAAIAGYNVGPSVDVVVPAIANQTATAKLIFTFDDGWRDNLTNAWPILNEAGFRGTMYVNRDIVTQPVANPEIMTIEDLNALYSYGWDLSNHTSNHLDYLYENGSIVLPYYEVGSSTVPADLAAMKAVYLDNQNWIISSDADKNSWDRGAYHAAYPSGLYSAPLIEILKGMGMQTGRATGEETPGTNQPIPVTNFYEMPVQFVETEFVELTLPDLNDPPGTNLTDVKNAIDFAVANGTTSILMLHKVEASKTNEDDLAVTIADLQTIVNYAKVKTDANQLSVMTMSEWYAVQPQTPVSTVSVKVTTNISIGASERLVAIIAPDNAKNKNVSWSSSNEAVATVDETGRVVGIAQGTANITVTTTDGSKTAVCGVTVDPSAATVVPLTTTTSQGVTLFLAVTGAKGTNNAPLAGTINVKVTSSDGTEGTVGVVHNTTVTFTDGAATVPVVLTKVGRQILTVEIAGVSTPKLVPGIVVVQAP